MAKLIGTLDWLPAPQFPTFRKTQSGVDIQFKYTCSQSNMAQLPAYGAALAVMVALDARLAEGGAYAWLAAFPARMRDLTVTPGTAGELSLTVVLNFGTDVLAPVSDDIIDDLVERRTEQQNVPLGQHPDYRTNWNHVLITNDMTIDWTEAPNWFYSATDKIIPEEDKDKYRWLAADADVPAGWIILWDIDADFRGLTAYLSGCTVAIRTIRSKSRDALDRSAEADFTIESPPETFDLTGQWLRLGSDITKDGKLWVLRVEYIHFLAINTQLYHAL